MCEVQSSNKCIEFTKEIKIGIIYDRCGHLVLIMRYSDVPWMFKLLAGLLLVGSAMSKKGAAYLSNRKQRKSQISPNFTLLCTLFCFHKKVKLSIWKGSVNTVRFLYWLCQYYQDSIRQMCINQRQWDKLGFTWLSIMSMNKKRMLSLSQPH